MIVMVPNKLRDQINAVLDVAIAECPNAEDERDELYQQLLDHYNEYGVVPDFTIQKRS